MTDQGNGDKQKEERKKEREGEMRGYIGRREMEREMGHTDLRLLDPFIVHYGGCGGFWLNT